MRLRDALRVQRGDVVAFVGAGGKTSALFRLAEELRAEDWRVLATTTSLASDEIGRAPLAARLTPDVTLKMIREWLNEHGFVLLYSYEDAEQREIAGLHPGAITELVDSVNSDVLLIEADGACHLPLKAPYEHEPVIPADASLVVPVAGIDVLGQPLDENHVYNAARIQARYGYPEGAEILPAWVAVTIRDPQLGLRGVPDSARVVALLNKVPANGYYRRRARRVAQLVLHSPRIEAVALGAVQMDEPVFELQKRVAAVVLAAGLSTRMGQSKALLAWDGRTVIEAIVARLLAARLSEIVVVSGYRGDDVTRVLAKLPVQIVHNPAYAQGEMLSSLQVGLRALSDSAAACLVVMGDQPSLDGRVVERVLAAYVEDRGEIVVPVYHGARGHPVLIDRRFWPELLALESGAPRDVIGRYPEQTALVDVNTDSILRDIDTPEQYRRERFLAGLR
jgi:molybdenum cofactor cytidylyltransferase